MSSINTNASAMTALQTLAATNKSLNVTQGRIATGLRVAEASDNAAYWSIATTMRSDNKALSTVQDSLGLGASKVDTAYTGMNKAIDTLNDIKVKLVAANGASAADKEKIDTEIKALQSQLKAYADGATFSGSNMLSVDTTTGHAVAGTADDVKIVSAFNRDASGTASISTIDVKVQDIKLYDASAASTGLTDGILDAHRLGTGARVAAASNPTAGAAAVGTDTYTVATLSVKGFSDTQIGAMLGVVEGALKEMTTAATNLGAAKSRIELQKAFTSSLMDSIDRGVGQLVDADMNKESTRLQALQVQQQLGIQALSIANGNSQSIMSLFRG
ncbi:flagellin [Aminobacter sp. NyZ550]|jgi:flagellin|uniref:Flagellin n=2 Tax=Aminobacter TaxID=31988 RepID=A0A142M3V4_AMIAI|nr:MULTISPECIES: flagellin [Aminobacter]AMS41024.1 flagellin [Aminobacter aminovorans]MBA8909529.1 flagellin [Aminobacter ciceronei]MBA9023300.1 flagellin [Aminobacter ciceronei]MBB3705998.1 flagellin [Aminobacter aminovorans]MRX35708.1 flagellin [Aminobacter sp. MDW-2]